jgi:hypothetical protein
MVAGHLDEEQEDDQREREEQPGLAHGGGLRAVKLSLACSRDARAEIALVVRL